MDIKLSVEWDSDNMVISVAEPGMEPQKITMTKKVAKEVIDIAEIILRAEASHA